MSSDSVFKLSARSFKNLVGVNPLLVSIVKRAIQLTEVDFAVIEGVRTPARQKELYEAGKSTTMNSRHLTGNAVDLMAWVDGKGSWDFEHYRPIAKAMKAAAEEEGVKIDWGGDWISFKDGPHFQLPWAYK